MKEIHSSGKCFDSHRRPISLGMRMHLLKAYSVSRQLVRRTCNMIWRGNPKKYARSFCVRCLDRSIYPVPPKTRSTAQCPQSRYLPVLVLKCAQYHSTALDKNPFGCTSMSNYHSRTSRGPRTAPWPWHCQTAATR